MRHILTAAAAFAVSGLLVSAAAQAQSAYDAGGAAQISSMCKVSTDAMGNDSFGYYAPCPPKAAAVRSGEAAYARAPSGTFEPGGVARAGTVCKVSTDAMGNDSFGYYAPCPPKAAAVRSGEAAYARATGGTFEPGGAARAGTLCKLSTDAMGNDSYGYYAPCK